MNSYWRARKYFLENDERCRVWQEKGITWVLHHKDPSWKHKDIERYKQWNIEDLLPMTATAHRVIHMTGNTYIRGEKNPMYGVHRYGKDNPNYGNHFKHSKETILKMCKAQQGEHNNHYGKHHSEESKQKNREAHLGENNSNFNTHWYNNGYVDVMSEECPEGFVPGRLPGYGGSKKGTHWYNNGITQVHTKECPEGFVPGRLKNDK